MCTGCSDIDRWSCWEVDREYEKELNDDYIERRYSKQMRLYRGLGYSCHNGNVALENSISAMG